MPQDIPHTNRPSAPRPVDSQPAGAKPPEVQDFLINVGPQHPATHGVLRLVTRLDGEEVVAVDPRIGYMHRSLEKMAEKRTYHQVVPFTDRTMDYVASMFNNWVYCGAAEKLLAVEVPERAEYLRVIVAEINRMASHLLSLGSIGIDTGATTYFVWCFAAREKLVTLLEDISGARLTYCYMRIGGVIYDAPEGWAEQVRSAVREVVEEVPRHRRLFHDNYLWKMRSRDIGVLGPEDAVNLGAGGPTLRGSGVDWDLRRDMPYSIYERFDFDVPLGSKGDVYDRMQCRLRELGESARIIEQALDGLPEGPVLNMSVPRLPAPEPGDAYMRIESPRGELGCYLVSDGSHFPFRMKIRAPSFVHLGMLPSLVPGHTLSDMVNILGSLDPVLGDSDR